MIRRPPRSTQKPSSAASDVYKRQEQFYQALRLRGIDSAMIRIPNTSHGIASRPSNLITKVDHILAWFEKYKNDID